MDPSVAPPIGTPDNAPPPYGAHFDHVHFSQPGFEAGAEITEDGRVSININTKNTRLAHLLAATLRSQPPPPPAYPSEPIRDAQPTPPLNIVVQIVGSRGDVQPFVALGKILKEQYGHRVRIATHATFRSFVLDSGLEFFGIGGDPAELMAFMVKHPGLMPGFDALKSGEISKRRKGIQDILLGCWRSCIEPGDGSGPPLKPHPRNEPFDLTAGLPGDGTLEPFVADVIIANPPSFAHVHVAEKLGIPLHMMFTMPWSPTRAFPHPLADVLSSNADDGMTNNLTYTLVEMMTWQGLGDVINRFREKALDLPPLSFIFAPGLLTRLKVPYTYCWSPALIPKPNDWGNKIDISGFFFLDLASAFTPEPALGAFLEAGPPPVYIGFGSIVVDDPDAMTRMIFDAVRQSGVRALVSKGWGGLGADDVGLPEGVHMLGNVPHDWLFQHVSCVVHHGGAGTTAAGIKAGKPTFVVPFFGDQPFWGAMVARAEAGPEPIRYKDLTAEKLSEALRFCLRPETKEKARQLGQKIREERGTEAGGESFHRQLDVESLRCSVAPREAAAWRVRRSKIRLSPLAAAVLVERRLLQYTDLKLHRPCEYNIDDQPPDPITAGTCSLVGDLSTLGMAIADMPREMFRSNQRSREATAPGPSSPGDSNHEASRVQSSTGHSGPTSPAPTEVKGGTPQASISQPGQGTGPQGFSVETAVDAGKGVGRVVSTGVKSPMNFCLGLAKGFRNVPRLYNDDTVRPTEKVTDLSSGIKVASKELGLGLFDGISGLVTQPMRGAEKEGASGLIKGFGKGIGGLITKPAAGFWGVPGYTMQGVHAEVSKLFSKSVQNYIMTSRVLQGQRVAAQATSGEKAEVVRQWEGLNVDLREFYATKNRSKAAASEEPRRDASNEGSQDGNTSRRRTRRSLAELMEQKAQRKQLRKRGTTEAAPPSSGGPSLQSDEAEYERAILLSVQETSRGNAQEDASIEAAIRKSVQAMRQQGGLLEPIPASGENKGEKTEKTEQEEASEIEQWKMTDEEYQELIEEAVRRSLSQHAADDDDDDEAEEEALQRAMAASLEESQRAAAAQQSEEDTVLDFIKKQSLAEEEIQRRLRQTRGGGRHGGSDEEEELRAAMEESLRMGGSGKGGYVGVGDGT
ncbi:hypothetical protein L249_4595 [Ophiocordyceps polyrhachis-furcata BCC 54312]|uniref:Uncharacterized protein n=1 Tax=Ophiocordyceps polyrhachis-furcata BCC 54312 TaxID=1330021 RepID=A0A367LBZ4_9HYPO|nr:hypothetical protein L249_4595 [Ophiocordyceps polyrhachis-furcata BCC 54312]